MLRPPAVSCVLAALALAPAVGCGGSPSSDNGGADAGAGSDVTTADGSQTHVGADGSVAADDGAGIDGAIGDDGGTGVSGLPWAGVLDPTRAIDWSQAGVVGGIPT